MRDRSAVSTIQPRGRLASRRSSARALRTTYPNRTIPQPTRARLSAAHRTATATQRPPCNARRISATAPQPSIVCPQAALLARAARSPRQGFYRKQQRAGIRRRIAPQPQRSGHSAMQSAAVPQLCGTNIVRPQAAPRARAARSPRQRRHPEVTARLNLQDHQRTIKEPHQS